MRACETPEKLTSAKILTTSCNRIIIFDITPAAHEETLIEFFMQNIHMQPVAAALPCPRPRAHVASSARVGVSIGVSCVCVWSACVWSRYVECVVCAWSAWCVRLGPCWAACLSGGWAA